MVKIRTDQIFEDIVGTIREPLLILDQDLRVILASHSFYEFFKVTPEETMGQLIYDLGNKQWDIPRLRELLEIILPDNNPFDNYEVEHDFATIGRRTMLLNARQIERAMGKERIILLAIEDITGRKRLEDLLTDSEERFRRLFETADDGILLLEKQELQIRHANPAITAMLGYSNEDCIGTNLKDVGFPDNIGNVNEIMQTLNEDGIINFKDVPLQKKTGQVVDADIYMVDRASLVQCNVRDITGRKRVDKALHDSKEKFQSMVDNIRIGVALISPTMEILELNQQMREWFPDVDSTMRPICYHAFNNPPRDEICDYCPTCRTLQDGKVHEAITETPTANGLRNYRVVSSPIFDKNGEVTVAIEMVDDITERISLEAQLRQAQKMEAIGTLAGGVAHDFNNILTTIIGNADLMLMDIDTDNPLIEEIKEIKMAGERAATLTSQLLAFSRKQIVQPKILDLNDVLENIEKMLVRLIGENIEILMIPGSALWKVEIDPGQVEQVLMNLVINAKDAMPIGGKLTIETVNIDLDDNYFAGHGIVGNQTGSYVLMTVSDTGLGMEKEVQKNIFDPFYTTKERDKGTGLGLSTVYGIVKQNNGFIWLYSEPGQGSTFKIYLPRVKRDVKEMEKEQPPVENFSGSEIVLIVEDDTGIRKLAQKTLQAYGYSVLVAENGEDALRISKEHKEPIDLMITDVVMPKMGGKIIAERLHELRPQMKIIYMSGYTDDAIVNHGVLVPGHNYLEKPFSPVDLARKVRQVLDKK
ncbi:PAS domain S-box protein [Thermodesulfobacteriota bacterium]